MKPTHYIFDVDDVILDMNRASSLAERAMLNKLKARLGIDAVEVYTSFKAGYATLRRQLRAGSGVVHRDFAALKARIGRWQRGVVRAGYEVKIFSRESLLAVALEDHDIPVTSDLIHEAVDHYWRVLENETRVLHDAEVMIKRLLSGGAKVHLATDSDGFLRFSDEEHCFFYDPKAALERKMERLRPIYNLGLTRADISIGDPVGKQNPAYYQSVINRFRRASEETLDLSTTLAVGDSLINDVLPFIQLGVAQGAWLIRGEAPAVVEGHPHVYRISDLTELEGLW